MIKVCTRCNEEKQLTDFKKNNRNKDGTAGICKACANEYIKANRNKWESSKYCPERYARNPDKRIKSITAWQKRNPEKCNAIAALRRSRKLGQTPEMTSDELRRIEDMYWLAKDLRAVSGQEYHVDHIMPLARGGLHHPDNLQILPADLNLSKGAKLPPLP